MSRGPAVCDAAPATPVAAASPGSHSSLEDIDPGAADLVERLCRELFSDSGPSTTPPFCTVRVLELAREPRANLADYAQLVESDPLLCERILALANGSVYTGLPHCESVAVAVLRIGAREVERLALRRAIEPRIFDLDDEDLALEISRHCWLAALASQTIARRTSGPSVAAFQAGLFHDIGKLAVLGVLAGARRSAGASLSPEFIRSAFDVYHAPAGETVCRKWGLPDVVTAAVASHHAENSPRDPLATAVFLGNHVAHALVGECDAFGSPVVDDALGSCGLTQQDLWELAALVAAQIEERQPTLA